MKPLVPRRGRGFGTGTVISVNLYMIAYACQRGAGRFNKLFAEILDGRIPCFRHPEKTGIQSTYVNVKTIMDMKISA